MKMDKVEKILKLAELGYTKDEINNFLKIGNGPEMLEISETATPEEEPAKEEKPPVPDYAENMNALIAPYFQAMQASLEEHLKAIQKANIRGSEMGSDADKITGETAIASIINPTRRK